MFLIGYLLIHCNIVDSNDSSQDSPSNIITEIKLALKNREEFTRVIRYLTMSEKEILQKLEILQTEMLKKGLGKPHQNTS